MLIDIVSLPYRYSDYDESFSTFLPRFDYKDRCDEISCFGRNIDLSIFNSDAVFKYKTIEFENNSIIERVFLIDDDLDTRKKFWTSNRRVYPLWMKTFSLADPIKGITFKYVNGIAEFHQMYVYDVPLIPAVTMFHRQIHPALNMIVPPTDTGVLTGDVVKGPALYKCVPSIDVWAASNNKLKNIIQPAGVDFKYRSGEFSRDSTEYPFEMETELCNTDCINNDWSMYELITRLNDLAVSDIRIEADARTNSVSIGFSSRYTGFFDYKHFPDYRPVVLSLERLFRETLKSRFGEVPWTKVKLEKLWTEEIYITVEVMCPGRSHPIETYYYIDLTVFTLGTVGMMYTLK